MPKVKIETLTPVHTGSGEELQANIEFLISEDRLAIVDDKKALAIIGEKNMQRWINIINSRASLLDLLKECKPGFDISDVAKRDMDVYGSRLENKQTLREQLHTPLGFPFIPGSSIKGAIRTAVIAWLVNRNQEQVKNLIQRKRDFLASKRKRWNKFEFEKLESDILNRLLSNSNKMNANTNTFRFLRVTDAVFEYDTLVSNMQVLNWEHNKWRIKRGTDQLTELIGEGCETEATLAINKELLERNIKSGNIRSDVEFLKSPESLMKIVNEHTIFLLKKEIDFWKENESQNEEYPASVDVYRKRLEDEILPEAEKCSPGRAVMRIGGGTGWESITGAWIKHNLNLLEDREWDVLSQSLNKHRNTDKFPKTRKLDEDGEMLGFVKLSVV